MPDVDDFHPVVPAVTGSGVTTPEFASWLSNLVDEVRELRAAVGSTIPGGTTGQALVKASAADGDVEWAAAGLADAASDGTSYARKDGAWSNALHSEVVEARGSRTTLHKRISTISNFASPNAGGIIVGQYYDNSFQGTASSTLAGAAGRVDLAPFYTSEPMRIDQLGIAVSTAVAAAVARCCIYGSDADGWPDALEYYGTSDLDCSAPGYKNHTPNYLFDSGRQYWLGVHQSSTATLRTINVSSAVNLGVNGATGSNYFTVLRRTITYASGLPSSWSFVAGDRVANVTPPSIRMRSATV